MSDASQSRAYLSAAIEQHLGDLELRVEFELSSPWTVLFGPSGAGKTSLLRALGGLSRPAGPRRNRHGEKPASGLLSACVIFRGHTLIDLRRGIWTPAGERRIGFVTQQPALFPHMNVAANIGFGLTGMGREARRERVAEMLDLFAAEALAGRMPAALSGGEKQRVALARALAPQPEMLLLDEPFNGLDAPLKDSILGNLTAWLRARNIPALYVSHDVAEAFQTGADVIVLRHGRIEAQGPSDSVLAGERERLLRQLDQKCVY